MKDPRLDRLPIEDLVGLEAAALDRLKQIRDRIEKCRQQLNKKAIAEFNLPTRLEQVLELILTGMINKEIGNQLNISTRTVKYHVKRLLVKFRVANRQELQAQCRYRYLGKNGKVDPVQGH